MAENEMLPIHISIVSIAARRTATILIVILIILGFMLYGEYCYTYDLKKILISFETYGRTTMNTQTHVCGIRRWQRAPHVIASTAEIHSRVTHTPQHCSGFSQHRTKQFTKK